jgi:hypothetical protein
VIERIIVQDGSLEIQHVIPLRDPSPSTTIASTGRVGLRSDRLSEAEVRPTSASCQFSAFLSTLKPSCHLA